MSKDKKSINYWNKYEERLGEHFRNKEENYIEERARNAWDIISKASDLENYKNLKWDTSKDPYRRFAHEEKEKELSDKESKEEERSEKILATETNKWKLFRHKYQKEHPESILEDALLAYNNEKNQDKEANLLIEEQFLNKKIIKTKYKDSSKKEFRTTLKNILDLFIINDIQEGIDYNDSYVDKICENIYNKVIDCYITGIKDEIQKKYPGEKLLNKYIPNNFYINHKNKNVIMYVTDNNLFEQMIEKEIIPNKKNIPIFGTLVNNPTGFIVCYDFLLPLIQIYKDSYKKLIIKNKIYNIFLHIGFMGFEFIDVPKLDDFFFDNEKKNVYYLNLNNLKPYIGSKKKLWINKEKFENFINNNEEEIPFDDFDFSKITDKAIKEEKKDFGKTGKPNYTSLYIAGAALAGLTAIGINDMYKSFTEKPNEFLKR
jgi:hypothetical protein